MEILLTGKTNIVTNSMCKRMTDNNKVVVCGENVPLIDGVKDACSFLATYKEEGYENIFRTYNFKSVVFFSAAVDESSDIFDEIEYLEHVLNLCETYRIHQFIYVSTTEKMCYEKEGEEGADAKRILLNACEDLCFSFQQRSSCNIAIVYIPHVFTMEHFETILGKKIMDGLQNKKISIPKIAYDTDFISDTDLGELFARMVDFKHFATPRFSVSGGNKMSMTELSNRLGELIPKVEIEVESGSAPCYSMEEIARKEYGWVPNDKLSNLLSLMVSKGRDQVLNQKKSFFYKIRQSSKKYNLFMKAFEIIFFYLIAELLNYYIGITTNTHSIDVRILFVAIIGTVYGMNMGIIAAILSSIGYIRENQDWQMIFYHVEKWLPFLAYFLVGTITGYSKEKRETELEFVKEQQTALEGKYVFLNELYVQTVLNKEQFNKQIINYRDSYGRMFSVVKKLNKILSAGVFNEAIGVLEDILDNHTIALYTTDGKSDFARLNVCSKEMSEVLTKSIQLSHYEQALPTIQKGVIWFNKERKEHYPDFIAPIFRSGELLGLIIINQVKFEQMTMDFHNKLSIICEMIKDSLLRAMEHEELIEHTILLPNTRIMKATEFEQLIALKQEMKNKYVAEYMLLLVKYERMDLEKLSNILVNSIRSMDVLGQRKDGSISLLLSQANKNNLLLIQDRIKDYPIHLEEITIQ